MNVSFVPRLALRRLAAFAIDWTFFTIYAGVLFLVVSPVVRPLFVESPLVAELAGFGLVTLPLFVYFAWFETARSSATIGKKIMKLRVRTIDGRRIKLKQSAMRSAIKLLPWELAHFAVWNAFIFVDNDTRLAGVVALVLSYLLMFIYVTMLFWPGHTLYDLVSKTRVVRVDNEAL